MTYIHQNVRQAMTAIAAVLALSSTPLLAQETAPPVTEEPAAPAADPPAAGPAVAPSAAPTPKLETTKTKVAAKPATTVRRTRATKTTTTRTATSKPVAPVESTPAVAAATPMAPEAAPPVAPGAMPVAEPDSALAKEQQSGFAELNVKEALPFAGAAGLGLLVWGGAAAARRRKRRKQQLDDQNAKREFIEHTAATHPEALQEEVVRVPKHDPVPARAMAGAPTTDLPEGFDLSRFGPHVQAAYRGPTEGNPSLSLKHRLRRATFFDQQERRAAAPAPAQAPKPMPSASPAKTREVVHASVPARGNWETRPDADFIFNRAASKDSKQPVHQD